MSPGDTPGDLRWPPPSDDLEPFELLEIVRDETGRNRWRRDHREPEVPDTYREWLPKRLGREAAVEHDELDLFPVAAAPATVAVPCAVPEPPMPVPLVFGPAATDTITMAPSSRAAAGGTGGAAVVLQPWSPPAARVDVPVPALRLSLVSAPTTPRLAPSSAHRTFFATAERMSLLAAGALMGMVVALAGVRESTLHRTGDEPGAVPVPQATTPQLHAAVPAPTSPREHDATAAAIASATLAVPAVTGPVQVEPLPVATPVPAPVQPARPPTRHSAAVLSAEATAPPRQTPIARRATRVSRVPPSEGPAILGTVQQYASAWSRLDARATQALWPSVDRASLVGTFTAIREQRLTLAGCKATVADDLAAVTCRGTLRYRPRVGEHSTRTEQGRWTFDLARHDQSWFIESVGRP